MIDENIIKLSNYNFKDIISDGITLVDFYADRCEPCNILLPVIDGIAEKNREKVKVGKLDVDKYMDIAIEYKVINIPTIIIFRDGEIIDKLIGLTDRNNLQYMIDKA